MTDDGKSAGTEDDVLEIEAASSTPSSLNLMILGARRSGTSSLHHYLQEHPQIAFVQRPDLDKVLGADVGFPYNNPFTAISARQSTRDAHRAIQPRTASAGIEYIAYRAVYSIYYPHMLYNLAEMAPALISLLSLRNPVDATYSIYCAKWQDGFDQSFEEFLGPEIMHDRLARDFAGTTPILAPQLTPPVVARGVYYPGIDMLYRLFSPEKICIVKFESLTGDSAATLKSICQFLNIDDTFTFTRTGTAKGMTRKPGPMNHETRIKLTRYFRPYNHQLFKLLDWPMDTWEP